MNATTESAFETALSATLLASGYVKVSPNDFDRERAIFPQAVLDFIDETRPKQWEKLEALHGTTTGERILTAAVTGQIERNQLPA